MNEFIKWLRTGYPGEPFFSQLLRLITMFIILTIAGIIYVFILSLFLL
jgi:hypothetical protein